MPVAASATALNIVNPSGQQVVVQDLGVGAPETRTLFAPMFTDSQGAAQPDTEVFLRSGGTLTGPSFSFDWGAGGRNYAWSLSGGTTLSVGNMSLSIGAMSGIWNAVDSFLTGAAGQGQPAAGAAGFGPAPGAAGGQPLLRSASGLPGGGGSGGGSGGGTGGPGSSGGSTGGGSGGSGGGPGGGTGGTGGSGSGTGGGTGGGAGGGTGGGGTGGGGSPAVPTPVPVPAGLPLMLLALGAIGLAARRGRHRA